MVNSETEWMKGKMKGWMNEQTDGWLDRKMQYKWMRLNEWEMNKFKIKKIVLFMNEK